MAESPTGILICFAMKTEGLSRHHFRLIFELLLPMTYQSNLSEEKVESRYKKKTYRHTSSERSAEQVRRWLHVCRTEHEKCNNGLDRLRHFTLPKRLLLVEASEQTLDTITLINLSSLEQPVRYVTLSHCWGNVTRCRLLEQSENIRERSCDG